MTGSSSGRDDAPPLEIERKFLLDRLPDLPADADVIEIEQGYLPDDSSRDDEQAGVDAPLRGGRLRRARHGDGRVECFHTIKTGIGLVREERERRIDEAEFQRLWPRTEGRRLRKRRHRVRDREMTWEIDEFTEFELALAEIELPSPDAKHEFPPWLAPRIVREVTGDASYANSSLAVSGPPRPPAPRAPRGGPLAA